MKYLATALALAFAFAALDEAVAKEGENVTPDAERKSDIGFASPEAAIAALRDKTGVTIREENGWVVASDPSEYTIWSLSQAGNVAHPTMVKRSVVRDGDILGLQTSIECGASKDVCDEVVQQFRQEDQAATEPLRDQN